jgi:hypothetical protein
MPKRTFTREDTDAALTALVLIGDATSASRYLAEQGIRIAPRTLRGWRDRHSTRLGQLENELAPQVAERVAARAERVAMRALDVQEQLLEKLDGKLDGMKPTDASTALRNVAVTAAIGFDKLSGPVRLRPNVIHNHPPVDELVSKLNHALGFDVISTAVEISAAAPALVTDRPAATRAEETP